MARKCICTSQSFPQFEFALAITWTNVSSWSSSDAKWIFTILFNRGNPTKNLLSTCFGKMDIWEIESREVMILAITSTKLGTLINFDETKYHRMNCMYIHMYLCSLFSTRTNESVSKNPFVTENAISLILASIHKLFGTIFFSNFFHHFEIYILLLVVTPNAEWAVYQCICTIYTKKCTEKI